MKKSASTRRPILIILGITLLALAFGMVTVVDRGITHTWPHGARAAWAFAIIALTMAGVLTALVGIGVLSSETLAAVGEGEDRAPSLAQFIAAYVGFLMIGIGSAVYFNERFGIQGERTIFVFCGILFAIASWRRPWWLYATIRRLGWFASIRSDSTMRKVLLALGLILVVVGIAVPWSAT